MNKRCTLRFFQLKNATQNFKIQGAGIQELILNENWEFRLLMQVNVKLRVCGTMRSCRTPLRIAIRMHMSSRIYQIFICCAPVKQCGTFLLCKTYPQTSSNQISVKSVRSISMLLFLSILFSVPPFIYRTYLYIPFYVYPFFCISLFLYTCTFFQTRYA